MFFRIARLILGIMVKIISDLIDKEKEAGT